jgi:hypothetical protein
VDAGFTQALPVELVPPEPDLEANGVDEDEDDGVDDDNADGDEDDAADADEDGVNAVGVGAEGAGAGAAGEEGAAEDGAGAGDAAANGVNDGVRSRGVKSEPDFGPESSPVVAGVVVAGAAGDEAPLFLVIPSAFLVIPSAGSGGAVTAEPPAFPVPAPASESAVFSSVEFPLALVTGVVPVRAALLVPVDPERELPDLVRDDDMELLSTTASVSATSVTSVSSSVT